MWRRVVTATETVKHYPLRIPYPTNSLSFLTLYQCSLLRLAFVVHFD